MNFSININDIFAVFMLMLVGLAFGALLLMAWSSFKEYFLF